MSQSVLRKVKGRARKAAEILPFSIKEVGYREFVSGRELLQQKIETIADKPVDPDLKYIQTKIKVEKIDHFKEMMKYVKKHGEVGIGRYIFDLGHHNYRMQQKYPHFFTPPAPPQLNAPTDTVIIPKVPEEMVLEH